MTLRLKVHHWPSRLAVGAIVLDSGLTKRTADEQAAARLHLFASNAYPLIKRLDARTFTKLLSYGRPRSVRRCYCRSCPPALPEWL